MALSFSICSCKISRHTSFFKEIVRDTSISQLAQRPAEMKIRKNDVLSITISSLSVTEDAIYNSRVGSVNGINGTIAAGFQVGSDGNIFVHNIGKIKAEGLTRKELKALLEKELAIYLKDPLVTINFSNHFVTVIGEVAKSQLFQIPDENISIIDLLAQSGATTPIAKLNSVLVIRDSNNQKEFKHVNLEDQSIFSSPFYYIRPNDVVVVNQDERVVMQQLRQDRYRQYSTVILQALSTVIIIYQAFFRK